MSAPSGDLVVRFERLAAQAPVATADPDVLWGRGRRRQRRRTASLLAGIAAVGVLATAVAPVVLERIDQPVAASSHQMVLPDVLRAPGPWEPAFSVTPHACPLLESANARGLARRTSRGGRGTGAGRSVAVPSVA